MENLLRIFGNVMESYNVIWVSIGDNFDKIIKSSVMIKEGLSIIIAGYWRMYK